MKKGKSKSHLKKKQQKAIRDAKKKILQRKANASVRLYIKNRRKIVAPQPESKKRPGLALDEQVSFAHCKGVGECCKNRPIYVEPTDVYRIMHNERAKEKFGLEVTMDLYSKDGNQGPLVYQVDRENFLPFCAVHRVELKKIILDSVANTDPKVGISVEEKDQVCPFFAFTEDFEPECILGDDRLTQCASDPIFRTGRLDNKRRLSGWEYSLIEEQCLGCRQAAEDKERNEIVGEWLNKCGMEERYIDSDLYHGFIAWHRKRIEGFAKREDQEFFWKMATNLMFDWHRFAIEGLDQPREEVVEHGPSSPKEVFLAARTMMEGIINGYQSGEEEVTGEGDGRGVETQGSAEED